MDIRRWRQLATIGFHHVFHSSVLLLLFIYFRSNLMNLVLCRLSFLLFSWLLQQQLVWSFAALSALRLDTTVDLLHTTFRTSAYLTYCRLSVSSSPSACSAQKFGINKTVAALNFCSLGIFLVWWWWLLCFTPPVFTNFNLLSKSSLAHKNVIVRLILDFSRVIVFYPCYIDDINIFSQCWSDSSF